MAVFVTLSTTLRSYVPDYDPHAGLSQNVPGPTTARALAQSIGLPLEHIKVVMINGRHAPLETSVVDGDRVAYFPAVGGG